jgi:hypothetical protein
MHGLSRRASFGIVLLAIASATATVTAEVRVPRARLAEMTRKARRDRAPVKPSCFGYSEREHAFACVGHDPIYNDDNIGAPDQATNFRIDVVGPKQQMSWVIAAIGDRPTTPVRDVASRLRDLDMRPLASKPVALLAGRWSAVGRLTMRLDVRTHEGDASYEHFGELRIRCPKSADPVAIDLRRRGLKLGGLVQVFLSPDRTRAAVGIVGDDGGEGAMSFTLDTAVIDLTRVCVDPANAVWTSRDSAHQAE